MKERLDTEGRRPLAARLFGTVPATARGSSFGGLDAAASYLGLTEDELRDALAGGKTLAEVARRPGQDGGRPQAGDARRRREGLDKPSRTAGSREAQAEEILGDLESRLDDIVNGVMPGLDGHHPGTAGAPARNRPRATRPPERAPAVGPLHETNDERMIMTSRFRRVITGATLVAALALGGAGVANALTSEGADAGVAALTSDVATGSDDQRAAETPSADATPAAVRDCPERSGDAAPDQERRADHDDRGRRRLKQRPREARRGPRQTAAGPPADDEWDRR